MLSLQTLSDRAEIQDVLIREAGAMDRRDWTAWRGCFTDDAAIDYSENDGAVGNPEAVGRWLASVLGRFHAYQHLSSNTEFEIDGDRARTRTMQYIAVKMDDPGAADGIRVVFSGIWFRDELARTKAGWRIAKRHEELAWRHNFSSDFRPPMAD